MSNTHPHIPRTFILILAALIIVALLVGILRAFAPARAASVAMHSTNTMVFIAIAPTATIIATDTANPTTPLKLVDMTGIIALGIILVAIIIFGSIWGRRTALGRITKK